MRFYAMHTRAVTMGPFIDRASTGAPRGAYDCIRRPRAGYQQHLARRTGEPMPPECASGGREPEFPAAFRSPEESRDGMLRMQDTKARKCVVSELRSRTICAPPGGGKTTLLLSICKRHPHRRFLFLTFSKDLQLDVQARARAAGSDLANVDVRTYDSFCLRIMGAAPGEESRDGPTDADVRGMIPGRQRRFSKGVGDLAIYCMNSTLPDGAIRLCDTHAGLEATVNNLVRFGAGGAHRTFAGLRRGAYRLATRHRTQIADHFDAILVDECQDLTEQAMRTIDAFGIPVVRVGDPMQRIFSFSCGGMCPHCRRVVDEAALASHDSQCLCADPHRLQLHCTYRLGASTCSYLHSLWPCFECVPASTEAEPADTVVHATSLQEALVHAENGMLVLCRTNAEICELAMAHPSWLVVGGHAIARDLQGAGGLLSSGRKSRSPLAKVAKRLIGTPEGLGPFVDSVRERDTTLASANTDVVLSTVHRCKGFETDHVLVTPGLASAAGRTDEEGKVAFVALSRHRKKLIVVERR